MMTNIDVTAIVLEKLRALFSEVFSSEAHTAQFLADPASAFAAHDIAPSDLTGVDIDQVIATCALPGGSASYGGASAGYGGAGTSYGGASAAAASTGSGAYGAASAGAVAAAGSSGHVGGGYVAVGRPGGGTGADDGAGNEAGGADSGHPGDGGYVPPVQSIQQVSAVTNQYYYSYDDHSSTVTVIGHGNVVESTTVHADGAGSIAAGDDLGNGVTGAAGQVVAGDNTGQANTGDGAIQTGGGIDGSVNTGVIDDAVVAGGGYGSGDVGLNLEFGAGSRTGVIGSDIHDTVVGPDAAYTDASVTDNSSTDNSTYSDSSYIDASDHLDASYTDSSYDSDVSYDSDASYDSDVSYDSHDSSVAAIESGPGEQVVVAAG